MRYDVACRRLHTARLDLDIVPGSRRGQDGLGSVAVPVVKLPPDRLREAHLARRARPGRAGRQDSRSVRDGNGGGFVPSQEVGLHRQDHRALEDDINLSVLFASRIGLEDGRPDMEIPVYSGGLGPLARAVFERVAEIQEGKVPGHQWIVEI